MNRRLVATSEVLGIASRRPIEHMRPVFSDILRAMAKEMAEKRP